MLIEGLRALIVPHVTGERLSAAARWAQRYRRPFLDQWFQHFPFLGNSIQYVLLLPTPFWFAGATAGRKLLFVHYLAFFLNNAVKDLLQLPRPPLSLALESGVASLSNEYGAPSTHTSCAIAFAAYCTAHAHRAHGVPLAQALPFALAHVAHIVFSRLYLGVHR